VQADRREARAVLEGTDDVGAWVRGRLLRLAESYAALLWAEREAGTARCATSTARLGPAAET
jgi:hypothetical protein